MFEGLSLETLSLEDVTEAPPSPPPNKAIKYGAIPVDLPPKKNNKSIHISESTTADGGLSYTIYILGCISYPDQRAVIELINILDYAGPDSEVTFLIDSPGGCLRSASRIVGAMRRSHAKITTMAIGLTASAAAFIWANGHTKYVYPSGALMIHMSSHGDWGNSTRISETSAAIVEYVKDLVLAPLLEENLLTHEEVNEIVAKRKDVYIKASDYVYREMNRGASVDD